MSFKRMLKATSVIIASLLTFIPAILSATDPIGGRYSFSCKSINICVTS